MLNMIALGGFFFLFFFLCFYAFIYPGNLLNPEIL